MDIKELIGKKVNNALKLSLRSRYPGLEEDFFYEIEDAKFYEEDDSVVMIKVSKDTISRLIENDEWYDENYNLIDEDHLWIVISDEEINELNFAKEEEPDGSFELLGENVDFQSATVPKRAMIHLIEFIKEIRKYESIKEMYNVENIKIKFDEDQELSVQEIMSYYKSMDFKKE